MPVSESYWPLGSGRNVTTHGQPEAFSMKRKAPTEKVSPWCPLPTDVMGEQIAKRQCLFTQQPVTVFQNPHHSSHQQQQVEMMEDANCNNNCSSVQDLNCQPTTTKSMPQWPSDSRLPNTHQHFTQQNDHMMNLCGEVSVVAEMDEACTSMDSDCVPNNMQYTPQSSPYKNCQQFGCGGGEIRATTSKVKCFCKPSWEGVMSMRPYVSDIY